MTGEFLNAHAGQFVIPPARGAALLSPALRLENLPLPALVASAGESASRRYLEFFTVTIRNRHTRKAYARAVNDFFAWCEAHGLGLAQIEPMVVAAYIEQLTASKSAPTVKQNLAAIRMLMDWLVTGHILPFNPAASVRGPKHVVKRGKTPVLTASEARTLLGSIESDTLIGRRDRALIAVMIFSFARIGAVLAMRVEDYYVEGRRVWFRLHEKGGKRHEVPGHHKAADYVDAYLEAAGIAAEKKLPLFRSVGPDRRLSARPMDPNDALRMIKRRAKAAGLSERIGNHTFRATGITAYRGNGGPLEKAQEIANHASPKTTKLYDRTSDEITLDEVERIVI